MEAIGLLLLLFLSIGLFARKYNYKIRFLLITIIAAVLLYMYLS